jgi:hypothetical protein
VSSNPLPLGSSVLIGEARAAAKEWVAANADRIPGFRGAFFSGSTAVLSSDTALDNSSDVDVVVVVASSKRLPSWGSSATTMPCST